MVDTPSTENLDTQQPASRPLAFIRFGVIEIIFVATVLALFFGTLNYFNILSVSKLNPQLFGRLPHKPYIVVSNRATTTPTPTPTIFPYDSKTAESLLAQYLKETLKPKFLPAKIDVKQGLSIDNRNDNIMFEFGSSFTIDKNNISATYHYKENTNIQNDFSIFIQPENVTQATATAALANSLLSTYFKNPYSISTCQTKEATSYCESFKTTTEGKTGYGIALNNTNSKLTSIVFTCFIPKPSKDYNALNSCISP